MGVEEYVHNNDSKNKDGKRCGQKWKKERLRKYKTKKWREWRQEKQAVTPQAPQEE